MHIEIRKIGNRKKYYLAHSYRKGTKVKKIRTYLGLDLSETELSSKRKLAEDRLRKRIDSFDAIGDPYVTVLSATELKRLKTLEATGRLGIAHLSEDEWTKFTEAFTYNTNAIEGSMVSEKEVADILERRKWPEYTSKEEIRETYGVAEAVKHIRMTKEHVSIKLILELHRIVFKNSKPFAGRLRQKGIEVIIADAFGNIVHRGAPATEIERLLNELVAWYDKTRKKYPPLVLAAVVHNQFENIHPFQDGNGRVGRLLLNNILLKHNLPPMNIELKHRLQYYAALQAYEKRHNLRPMLELMLMEYFSYRKSVRRR